MNPIYATHDYAGRAAEAAYSRWAPVYDLIFDLPFHPGRAAAARAAAEAAGKGGEVLVVGVGTGLELPLLPRQRAGDRRSTSRRRCCARRAPGSSARGWRR